MRLPDLPLYVSCRYISKTPYTSTVAVPCMTLQAYTQQTCLQYISTYITVGVNTDIYGHEHAFNLTLCYEQQTWMLQE